MAESLASLYLIAGTDQAKIDATRARLRARAEGDGGAGALQIFEPSEGRGGPDHEALLPAIPAMSLTETRRYLLADGVERWRDKQLEPVVAALGTLPPDLTVVLIARAKAPAKLVKAVKAAKGEIHEFEAPKARDMPRLLVADAKRLGFALEPAAARMLVERMGANPVRLRNELERLALWAGEGGRGQRRRPRSDGLRHLRGRRLGALRCPARARSRPRGVIAERLISQGENVTGLIYGLASRLRKACAAAAQIEEGVPAKQVESSLWHAPLRGEAAGRPPGQDQPRRAARGDRWRLPISRSGAAAARTTATSWRSRWRCRRAAGAAALATWRLRRRRRGPLWTSCGRRCSCAGRPSARPCRPWRRARGARPRSCSRRRPQPRFEAAEIGLHRAREQAVLGPLALAA